MFIITEPLSDNVWKRNDNGPKITVTLFISFLKIP